MFEFSKPIFIIRDPKLIKQMAIKDFDNFTDHRVFFDESMNKILGKSLVTLRGQKWKGRLISSKFPTKNIFISV